MRRSNLKRYLEILPRGFAGGQDAGADEALPEGITPAEFLTEIGYKPPGSDGDWFAGLPAELQSEKSLTSFKGKPVADVARSYVEGQKLVGGSIRLPKADAKPDERSTFVRDIQTKLGLPEAADKYQVRTPDGIQLDDGMMKSFLPLAHKIGLLPEQVQALVEWEVELGKAVKAQTDQALHDAEQALRDKWGGAFDRKFQLADRLITEHGGAAREKLMRAGLQNDPDVIAFLAELAEPFAEHGRISGEVEGAMSPEEALQTIKAAEADPKHDHWKKTPEEQRKVFQLAYGTKPVAV